MCAAVAAMALTSMPLCSTVSISLPLPSLFFLKELKPEEIFYYFCFLLSSDDASHTVN